MKVNYVPFKKQTVQPQLDPEGNPLPTLAPPKTQGSFESLDPITQRQALSESILQEGMDSSPTKGGIGEGFARLGKALLGGYMKHRADSALDETKKKNQQFIKDAFDNGDYGSLITSEDPVAQKLGAAIIQQQFKGKSGHYADVDGTKVWESDDGGAPTVINRPIQPIVNSASGTISYDRGQTWQKIPDFVENKKKVSEAGRAPPKPAKSSSKFPWEN